jgi:hypothetical protein
MCYDQEKTQAPIDVRELKRMRDEIRGGGQADCANARSMSSEEILAELFKYHAPTDVTIPKFAAINQAGKNFAEVILQNCPPGMDRTVAINYIRLARMLANASVALNGLSL